MDLFEDNIFKNDVIYMKSLIGRTVKITTANNQLICGTVYVIDPVYKTIVLHTKETAPSKPDTVFVLHHAIQSLEVDPGELDETYIKTEDTFMDTSQAVDEKKRLKKWLEQMYINVDEVGVYLKIDDHLLIMPPYGLDNCICNNIIILEKIRNIISLMPSDFV